MNKDGSNSGGTAQSGGNGPGNGAYPKGEPKGVRDLADKK